MKNKIANELTQIQFRIFCQVGHKMSNKVWEQSVKYRVHHSAFNINLISRDGLKKELL